MTCRKRVLERVGPETARLLRQHGAAVTLIGRQRFLPVVCGGSITMDGTCSRCRGRFGSRASRPVEVVR